MALRRRIAELEEETAILKKAEAYFAKHDRKSTRLSSSSLGIIG